jgi:hypothetical protein
MYIWRAPPASTITAASEVVVPGTLRTPWTCTPSALNRRRSRAAASSSPTRVSSLDCAPSRAQAIDACKDMPPGRASKRRASVLVGSAGKASTSNTWSSAACPMQATRSDRGLVLGCGTQGG